ncbi:hypothetical protein H6F96_06590 [Microcoleus sp. FACHB-53]|nr:hypothetical protein [Microcoleus sp. FACHB-53]
MDVIAGCCAIAVGGVPVGSPAWAMASRVTQKAPQAIGEYFRSLKLGDDTDEQRFVEVSSCPFGNRPYQTRNFSTIE